MATKGNPPSKIPVSVSRKSNTAPNVVDSALNNGNKAKKLKKKKKKNNNNNNNDKENGTVGGDYQVDNSQMNNGKSISKKSDSKSSTKVVVDSLSNNVLPIKENNAQYEDWHSPIQILFLWLMSAIYLFAFVSFYYQIRGLYGNNGILPLRHLAGKFSSDSPTKPVTLEEIFIQLPSLVWMLANLGLSYTTALEVVTLFGVFISVLQLLYSSYRVPSFYLFQFILYGSIVNVGQTFLYFQWDSFILEAGALTIFISITSKTGSWFTRLTPHPSLPLWTIRWLLFRFMFSSGVVKLTSNCPIWWSLRSLDVHFESQCIPTPLSWYAHQLPQNWLRLATALTLVLEIVLPFAFFTPFKSLKIFSFITQVLFQISIILSGNYNFFNLLTIVLCITLLDDNMFRSKTDKQNRSSNFLEVLLVGCLYGMLAYYTLYFFPTEFKSNYLSGPVTKVNFNLEQFQEFLTHAITASIWLGIVSLVMVSLYAIYKSISYGSLFGRLVHLISTLFYVYLCSLILALSTVPLAELDSTGAYQSRIPVSIKQMYKASNGIHLMSGYGLFRVMTGENGRPELIVEGSNDVSNNANWKAYHFQYKPGDLYTAPKFNIPHQPRLDWQMWFAALGSYQHNPWLIQFCYRLLTGEPDVINLLDRNRLPFPVDKPPKYLRISRYTYKYTDNWTDRAWWKQATNRHDYLPTVNKATLEKAIQFAPLPKEIDQHSTDRKLLWIKSGLDRLYSFLVVDGSQYLPPHVLMITLVVLCLLVTDLFSQLKPTRSNTVNSS